MTWLARLFARRPSAADPDLERAVDDAETLRLAREYLVRLEALAVEAEITGGEGGHARRQLATDGPAV